MEIKHAENSLTIRSWHVILLALPILLGIFCLVQRLWNVQVLDSPQYGAAQSAQSFRRVLVPAIRGKIYDRNGILLADNKPTYAIVLYCEQHRKPGKWSNTTNAVNTFIDELSERLQLPRETSANARTAKDVERHMRQSLPMPLILWKDVDYSKVAYISEWADELPGVDIITFPKRTYPNGTLAAHVLGYVGASTRQIKRGQYHYRLPEFEGRSAIEYRYNDRLSGEPGESLLRVDSRGYTHYRSIHRQATPGKDLTLTLDVNLQRTAEAALANRPGAIVAIDPRNGDILTLASAPTYNIDMMVPPIEKSFYQSLTQNPEKPLINRAVQTAYAPGSIFKPFVAIAAQEENYNADTLHDCNGIYTDYNARLRCANRYGHGELDLRGALMKSCNPYFCYVGTSIGMDAILRVAKQAGLGKRTGIDLGGESAGHLPAYRDKKTGEVARRWTPVDTAQCAIGQGQITTTPLQMAHATATLAMGGKAMRPRLVADTPEGECIEVLPWNHDYITAVIEGMEAVVTGGTGKTMQIKGVNVAGKTGTAEFIKEGTRERKKHVWCIAFAPIENPQIAVCAMLDEGSGGGKDAGPMIQQVLATYFNVDATKVYADEETLED
ncbi:MAG: penicillin-binding protein 2 [bacterium]|nr:penicillin-binding protein 2 [bacterium]